MKEWIEQDIEEVLTTNYMPYAMLVIIARALPSVYDGLKPSHRKLLYTMHEMGLLKGNRTKSANIVGQTMKLNPHGDGAIYETMVRLTTDNESLLLPYVDSKGNFGKIYSRDMAYAASRYTEAKLNRIASEFFVNIDKEVVDFHDNYDGSLKEPSVLPTTFPAILANPNQGIAVGMASNICSFNLNELCDATIQQLEGKTTMLIPDFPTGGKYLFDAKELEKIMTTGKGSIVLRAEYVFMKEQQCIEITSIPYTTKVEVIIDKICDLIKEGKLREITDVRDETDLSGLRITLDLKKGTDVEMLMQKLFKHTPLQDTFSCNFNVLVKKGDSVTPKVMGTTDILEEWIAFRIETIKREIQYTLKEIDAKLHVLEGFKTVLFDLDLAIKTIRAAETKKEAYHKLIEVFSITLVQAESIGNIMLIDLNEKNLKHKLKEYDTLLEQRAQLNKQLCSDKLIKRRIKKELEEIKRKYGKERCTQVVENENLNVSIEKTEEPCYLVLTKENYAKVNTDHHTTHRAQQKLKEGDEIRFALSTTTASTLLVFTDKGNCYKVYVSDIPFSTPSQLGTYLPTFIEINKDESILSVQMADKDYNGDLLTIYESNQANRIPLKAFQTETKRNCLKNAISIQSPLVNQYVLTEEKELFIKSSVGTAFLVHSSVFKAKASKNALGDLVIEREPNLKIIKAQCIEELNESDTGELEAYTEGVRLTPTLLAYKYDFSLAITSDFKMKWYKGYRTRQKGTLLHHVDGAKVKSLLVFTNAANCHILYPGQCTLTEDFIPMASLIEREEGEQIVSVQVLQDEQDELINVYKNNQLSRIPLQFFVMESKKTCFKKALADDLAYQCVLKKEENIDLFLQSKLGKSYIVSTKKTISQPTKNALGQLAVTQEPDFKIEKALPLIMVNERSVPNLDTYTLPVRTEMSPVEEVVKWDYSFALTEDETLLIYPTGENVEGSKTQGKLHDYLGLFVFTTKGLLHTIYFSQLSQAMTYQLTDWIDLSEGESILSVLALPSNQEGYLINVFEDNRLAKIRLSSFKTELKQHAIKQAISTKSRLIEQFIISEDCYLMAKTIGGYSYCIDTSLFKASIIKDGTGNLFVKSVPQCTIKKASLYKPVLPEEIIDKISVIEETCYVSIKEEHLKISLEHKEGSIETTNKACLLVFTNQQNCYKLYLTQFKLNQLLDIREHIPLSEQESILSVQVANSQYSGYLINLFENNRLAKIALSAFRTETNRSCLKNSLPKEGSLLLQCVIEEDIQLYIKSSEEESLIVNTNSFKAKQSKNSKGDLVATPDQTLTTAQCLGNTISKWERFCKID